VKLSTSNKKYIIVNASWVLPSLSALIQMNTLLKITKVKKKAESWRKVITAARRYAGHQLEAMKPRSLLRLMAIPTLPKDHAHLDLSVSYHAAYQK
jgi:hypothetical protein